MDIRHWNVYQKWNARLFKEMYQAWKLGRGGAKDPSEFWYEGEIGFLDFYIIPLAKKLKECGVFGASSDEFLQVSPDLEQNPMKYLGFRFIISTLYYFSVRGKQPERMEAKGSFCCGILDC